MSDDLLALLNLGEYEPPSELLNCAKTSNEVLPTLTGDIVVPEGLYPSVDNVVASAHLNTCVDLKGLTFRVRNAEFNPRKVNACVIRLRSPKCTILIYAVGKVMVTGVRTPADSATAVRKAAKLLALAGYKDVKITDFKVENIVASTDVLFPVRLEQLANEWKAFTSYEPEVFPGLVFRMHQPKMAILVFVSGKVVFTGARDQADVHRAFENIYVVLDKFRR